MSLLCYFLHKFSCLYLLALFKVVHRKDLMAACFVCVLVQTNLVYTFCPVHVCLTQSQIKFGWDYMGLLSLFLFSFPLSFTFCFNCPSFFTGQNSHLLDTVTTLWLESDSVVTIVNCTAGSTVTTLPLTAAQSQCYRQL